MDRQKEEIRENLGIAVLMALFLLFFLSLSQYREKQGRIAGGATSGYGIQQNFTAVNDAQLLDFQKNIPDFVVRRSIPANSENDKIMAGNRLFHQRLISLRKEEIRIKPEIHPLFYSFYFHPDPEIPPVLS